MNNLKSLLVENGITSALVIDDAYDELPSTSHINDDGWNLFFEEIELPANSSDKGALVEAYPKYESEDADALKHKEDFVHLLWKHRHDIRACAHLFEDYERTHSAEKTDLDGLVASLESLGLTCETAGRDLDSRTVNANLVFIDLYLEAIPRESGIAESVRMANNLIKARRFDPPLVVLISRSPSLDEKGDGFRDDAGLMASTFRVAKKSDLVDAGKLETLLLRLVGHYADAKKVAAFVNSWEDGLLQARDNFVQLIRKLDLPDLAQIQDLLLDAEGQKLGEYLLGVSDRVLQHEIEGIQQTVDSAKALNDISWDEYPAPHLDGSPDLKGLVYQMVFVNPGRLPLSESDGNPELQFGDILLWKKEKTDVSGDKVSLVVTPACDLVRRGASSLSVMLLTGELKVLRPEDWSYRPGPKRTPIAILSQNNPKWIEWDMGDVESFRRDKLDGMLASGAEVERVARMRELYALEIQRSLLERLGRIGSPANLPVHFPVTVDFFYADKAGKAARLIDEEAVNAACYVGRGRGSKPIHRLVLSEQICDELQGAVMRLQGGDVHQRAKGNLQAIQGDAAFFVQFEKGMVVPVSSGKKPIRDSDESIRGLIIRKDPLNPGDSCEETAALIVLVKDMPDAAEGHE